MSRDQDYPWVSHLAGKRVIAATENTLTLSDGSKMIFDQDNYDCCSWIKLTKLATTDNIITHAEVQDDEDEMCGPYRAWVHVVTTADELNLAEAEGDASNGYYLHGFALNVRIVRESDGAR